MKTPVLERTSAAKAGWLIILLTVGWVVFLLWPDPAEKKAAKPAVISVPTTSLTRAGLAEYTDWAGLPEIFAIWADKAEWKDGRTRFAYWHPVMKTYSYYFEAVRVGAGYRFKEIAEPKDPDYDWDESLGEDCPIRFYRSLSERRIIIAPKLRPPAPGFHGKGDQTEIKLDIPAQKILRPETKITPVNPAQKP